MVFPTSCCYASCSHLLCACVRAQAAVILLSLSCCSVSVTLVTPVFTPYVGCWRGGGGGSCLCQALVFLLLCVLVPTCIPAFEKTFFTTPLLFFPPLPWFVRHVCFHEERCAKLSFCRPLSDVLYPAFWCSFRQVAYWEPCKWVSKLRDMATTDNPLYLKIGEGS